MEPIKAICSKLYSEVGRLNKPDEHFMVFSVRFENEPQWHQLKIKTDKDHNHPYEFSLDNEEFRAWKEESWQSALYKAWHRYFVLTGFCAATTNEMVYMLNTNSAGSYSYDLDAESKKNAAKYFMSGANALNDINIKSNSGDDTQNYLFTNAPKIITDDPENPVVKRLLESLKNAKPKDTRARIDEDFLVKTPAVTITLEDKANSRLSTAKVSERLNSNQYDVVYNPKVEATEANLDAAIRKFEEVHNNRPLPGSSKGNVRVSHSFEVKGPTYNMADLIKMMAIKSQSKEDKTDSISEKKSTPQP